MAAHRGNLTASVCVLTALLGCPAPALADGPKLVPDEAALTEYVGVLPGAQGPVLPPPAGSSPSSSRALPARVDGALAKLPADRKSALRRLATDPSLGAPADAASSAAIDVRQPSAPSAIAGALGAVPASAIVLAVLLVLVVLGAAAARVRRGSPA
jgi:hypothetical protein